MVHSYGLDAKLAIGVVAGLSSALTYLHNPAIGMVSVFFVVALDKFFAWFHMALVCPPCTVPMTTAPS